jgi:DNA-binding NarL/FixJ family response regulator
MICHNYGTFVSMLNALYVTRKNEGPEFERRVTAALRSAHLRRLPVAKAMAGPQRGTAPDLIVAGLGEHGPALVDIRGLRRAFPTTAIVITSRKLSEAISSEVYRAGATAVVPLDALSEAIANLMQVFEAGSPKKAGTLDETMIEEFHDRVTGRLDADAVARSLGISVRVLAKAVRITPSALSKRPHARAAQDALRKIEFAIAGLRRLLGSDARVRAWLNAAHPDLGGNAPLALFTKGSATDFADYVMGVLSGQPT